jgi:hypothetical protein
MTSAASRVFAFSKKPRLVLLFNKT